MKHESDAHLGTLSCQEGGSYWEYPGRQVEKQIMGHSQELNGVYCRTEQKTNRIQRATQAQPGSTGPCIQGLPVTSVRHGVKNQNPTAEALRALGPPTHMGQLYHLSLLSNTCEPQVLRSREIQYGHI